MNKACYFVNKFLLKFFVVCSALGVIFFVVSKKILEPKVVVEPSKDVPAVVQDTKDETVSAEVVKVIKLDATSTVASIEYNNTPKRISEWKNALEQEIVINGAYFLEDFTPAGFLVVDKKKVGPTLFDQDKSGLLVIENGQLSVRDLNVQPIQKNEAFEFALQSYPFLIKNSQKAIKQDSGKIAFRTAVGVDVQNNVYVLSVLSHQISLYEFMNEIVKLNIPFTYVLNLDGGPSTGLFVNWGGDQMLSDSLTGVSSIVRFRKK